MKQIINEKYGIEATALGNRISGDEFARANRMTYAEMFDDAILVNQANTKKNKQRVETSGEFLKIVDSKVDEIASEMFHGVKIVAQEAVYFKAKESDMTK